MREAIRDDSHLAKHMLAVARSRKPGRAPGWLKLHSLEADRQGAINIEWHAAGSMLLCRVVNRGAGTPAAITADFFGYILERFPKRIRAVTILPG